MRQHVKESIGGKKVNTVRKKNVNERTRFFLKKKIQRGIKVGHKGFEKSLA
jgi:hypothetical protein